MYSCNLVTIELRCILYIPKPWSLQRHNSKMYTCLSLPNTNTRVPLIHLQAYKECHMYRPLIFTEMVLEVKSLAQNTLAQHALSLPRSPGLLCSTNRRHDITRHCTDALLCCNQIAQESAGIIFTMHHIATAQPPQNMRRKTHCRTVLPEILLRLFIGLTCQKVHVNGQIKMG